MRIFGHKSSPVEKLPHRQTQSKPDYSVTGCLVGS